MKKYIFLFLIFSIISYPQQKGQMDKIQKSIQQVKEKYAPDKRTAIFDVNAEADNDNFVLSGETNLKKAKEELISDLNKNNLKFEDKINLLPDNNLGEEIYGVIDLSTANIRANKADAAELVTQSLLGTPIKIYKRDGGWFLIQTPDKYLGWTETDSFRKMNKSEFEKWQNADKVIFVKKYGTAYSKPDLNSLPVSDLVMGNILINHGTKGEFTELEYPDKRIGYVLSSNIEVFSKWLDGTSITVKNILNTADQFTGIPYLWGGTSDKGFDCSGFTKTVYFMNGLILPRDASQQVFVGESVDTHDGFESLKPGDLLFFGRKATQDTKEKITHVGLYIGNYDFINSSGRVRINSLKEGTPNFSDYRLQTFIRAKRIIGVKNPAGVTKIKNSVYTSGLPDYNE